MEYNVKILMCLFVLLSPSVSWSIETISGTCSYVRGLPEYQDESPEVNLVLIELLSSAGFNYNAALTNQQRKEYEGKVNFHRKEGQRCFNEAQGICLLIPDARNRDIAMNLFKSAIATSAGGRGWSGVVAGLTVLLIEYGCAVLNEYNRMNDLLLESKAHFELMEFYQTVLIKG